MGTPKEILSIVECGHGTWKSRLAGLSIPILSGRDTKKKGSK